MRLLENNQCNIYSLRPLICRFYPFEFKFDLNKETDVFDFTLECPAINQGKVFEQKDFEKLFELEGTAWVTLSQLLEDVWLFQNYATIMAL